MYFLYFFQVDEVKSTCSVVMFSLTFGTCLKVAQRLIRVHTPTHDMLPKTLPTPCVCQNVTRDFNFPLGVH